MSSGFSFGAAASTTGFNFGAKPTNTTQASSGFSFGITSTASNTSGTPSLGGFGATAATTASSGFFGLSNKTTAPSLGTGTGLTFGGGGLGSATTTLTTSNPSKLSFTGLGQATSGFGIAKTTVSGFTGFGASTTTTTPAMGTGIFANTGVSATTTANTLGLGGIDPKTTSITASGAGGINGKGSDNKIVKESQVPNEICVTVDDFKKYVKEQKTVRENITRLSSKPMFKVQEEVSSLKQLLSLVSNGLHKNTIAINKLKKESAQELKHAEMAHRTKDTPAGLQYENTVPTEYFHILVEDFERRMVIYRQQIEDTENHLASFNSSAALSPQDLALLLNKLHESFVALAAQLQTVHEYVQSQKEQYMNYRKVFHADTTDIFERRKNAQEKTGSGFVVTAGPTPFSQMSSAAASAMASAMNRTQQPQVLPNLMSGGVGFQQQTTGGSLFGSTAGTGLFGAQPAQQQNTNMFAKPVGAAAPFGSAFGSAPVTSTGFSFSSNTAAVKPLGATGFSSITPQTNSFGGGLPTAGGFGSSGFQLSSPPFGNKRGKKS